MACHCGEVVPCMLTQSRDVRSKRGGVVGGESLECGPRLDAQSPRGANMEAPRVLFFLRGVWHKCQGRYIVSLDTESTACTARWQPCGVHDTHANVKRTVSLTTCVVSYALFEDIVLHSPASYVH